MKKLLLCLFVLFFSGFSFAEAPAYKTISWDKAIEMYKSKKGALFVDVRTPDEVSQGTVSRSINGKYIQTPRGVFEIKYFFSSGITDASGEGMSSNSIKTFIKEIVEGEDPKKP